MLVPGPVTAMELVAGTAPVYDAVTEYVVASGPAGYAAAL